MISLVSRKLDQITLREWEKQLSQSSAKETLGGLIQFLESRARYLGNIAKTQVASEMAERRSAVRRTTKSNQVAIYAANTREQCPVCQADHALYQCSDFKALSFDGRRDTVRSHNRCYNCLGAGHGIATCSRMGCPRCNKKHHSLLHKESGSSVTTVVSNSCAQLSVKEWV